MLKDKFSSVSLATWRSTRRVFVATIASALVTPVRAKADLFGSDIPILLGQLEQQFKMVSSAIATVQNLVRTVEELQTVVSNGKTLLEHAGDNGLEGVLDAAQGTTSLLRGSVRDLRRINSSIGWWQNQLSKSKKLDSQNAATLSQQSHEWHMQTLDSASTALDAYQTLDDSYRDLEQSQGVVKAAGSTPGVVGQLQLIGRQNYYTQKSLLQLATTQARGMQVLTNGEAGRSFEEQRRRKNTEDLLKGWEKPGSQTTGYAELPNP